MKLTHFFFTLAIAASCLIPTSSQADVYLYQISNPYSSSTTPTGGAPWGIITFQDTVSNHVQLSIEAPSSLGSQFISQLNFNFDPTQLSLLNSLSITNTSGIVPKAIQAPDSNAYSAGPSQKYDFQIDFTTANNASKRLIGGTSSYFDITGTGLTASMFNFTNEKGMGPFITAVHIQNIPVGDGSVWASNGEVQVPEPSTYVLMGSFLALVALLKYRTGKTA